MSSLLTLFALGLILLFGADQANAARTVAFVAGVGAYDEGELNKLKFTARDARDVFEQLRLVAELDEVHSRLVLAAKLDDPWVQDLDPDRAPYRLLLRERLTKQEFEDEFSGFIENLRDDDTAIIYLGGHGTAVNRSLVFLPSDYSISVNRRYLRYDNLMRDLKDRLAENGRVNVKIVFLGNMCGAGNAEGVMNVSDPLEADFVRHWLESNRFGLSDFAFIPATAPNQNTFEREDLDGGRSIFAYNLIRALKGRGNDLGYITSDWLFNFIDDAISDQVLPRDDSEFAPDIVIAKTHREEAEGTYLLGMALLSAAQSTGSEGLGVIAGHMLTHAKDLSSLIAPKANLWLGVREAAAGRRRSASLFLDEAKNSVLASPEIHQIAEPIAGNTSSQEPTGFSSPAALKMALEAGTGFYVGTFKDLGIVDAASYEFLESFPGFKGSFDLRLPPDWYNQSADDIARRATNQLESELKNRRNQRSSDDLLILIYDGRSIVSTGDGHIIPDENVPLDAELLPISARTLISAAKIWGGPMVVINSAPFGGLLKRAQTGELEHPVSLFLGAPAVNGMTFGGTGASGLPINTGFVMATALKQGIENLMSWTWTSDYLSQVRRINIDSNFSSDIPQWIADWPASDVQFKSAAQIRLDTLPNWPLALVSGCQKLDLNSCDISMPEEAGAEEFSNALITIGKWDVVSSLASEKNELARRGYHGIIGRLSSMLSEELSGAGVARDIRESARRQFDRLLRRLTERAEGLDANSTRTIRFLDITVDNYESPYIPDLAGPVHDRGIWKTALENMGFEIVDTNHEVSTPQSNAEVFKLVKAHLNKLGPDDLTILYVAGRGIEYGGRRYIALPPAYTENANNLSLRQLSVRSEWPIAPDANSGLGSFSSINLDHFIAVEDIASLFGDRWLLAIWDAQFTDPTISHEEGRRHNAIYDRHLHATWPRITESPTVNSPAFVRELRPQDDAAPSGRQIHLMFEGRLTEGVEPQELCNSGGGKSPTSSPFSGAVLSVIEEAVTNANSEISDYRDLAASAVKHPCISSAGRVAVQGNLALPLLASGPAAEHVAAFASGAAEKDMILGLTAALADLMNRQYQRPIYRIAALATRVERVALPHPAPGVRTGIAHLPRQSRRLFKKLHEDPATAGSSLGEIVYDYGTRPILYSEQGRLSDAQRIIVGLRGTSIESSPVLLKRLLDLTRIIAEKGVADALETTRGHIDALQTNSKTFPREIRSEINKLISNYASQRTREYAIQVKAQNDSAN